jgi:hypothetical protein
MIAVGEGTSIGRRNLAKWDTNFSFLKISPVEQGIDVFLHIFFCK